MTSSTDLLLNVAYSYDGVKRLTRVTGEQAQEYRYDAIGNRLYAHEEKPDLPGAVTTGFQYDGNGNLEEEKDSTGKTLRTFTWDAENRLTRVVKGNDTNNATADYRYDPNGGRVKKTVTRTGGIPSTTLYFGPMVEEVDGEMVKYYYAGNILVAKRVAKPGPLFYYHADRLGSTKLITNAAGSADNNYAFAAFGRTVAKSGAVANERGFTGQREDMEVGLIYMGARYYDPVTGRFISPDTIVPDPANPQSLNRYAYALNNPISYVDPSGHAPVAVAVFSAYCTSAAVSAGLITAANAWVATVAWMGAGLTAVGYFSHNEVLSTIGSVMLGFSGGFCMPTGAGAGALMGMNSGILGASVSLAISPLSPLDPGVKQAIGWAYMAYGVYKGLQESRNANPEAAGGSVEDRLSAEQKAARVKASKDMARKTLSSERGGVRIKTSSGVSRNIRAEMVDGLEKSLSSVKSNFSEFESIFISSTTGGHSAHDWHTLGAALDISHINGIALEGLSKTSSTYKMADALFQQLKSVGYKDLYFKDIEMLSNPKWAIDAATTKAHADHIHWALPPSGLK